MNTSNRRGSLFLLELLCCLALFVVCACVCVGLIVHAWGLSRESEKLTQAVYLAQTAAEEWRAGILEESDSWCTAGELPECHGEGGRVYNGEGDPFSREEAAQAQTSGQAVYALYLTTQRSAQGLTQGTITVYASGQEEPLYTLEVTLP